MKKITICLILFAAIVFSVFNPLFLSNAYSNSSIFSGETELTADEDLILETASNQTGFGNNKFTVEELDYNRAFKVYINTKIAIQETLDYDNLNALLDEHVYYLPVYHDGETYNMSLNLGKEIGEDAYDFLDQETLDYLERVMGRWHVVLSEKSSFILDFSKIITEFIEKKDLNIDRCFVLGSVCNGLSLTLAYENEQGEINFFSFYDYGKVPTESIGFDGDWIDEKDIFTLSDIQRINAESCIFDYPFPIGNNIAGIESTSQNGKWIKTGSKWQYRHPGDFYSKDGWEIINNKWYLFDDEGWLQTGWQKLYNHWFYLGGVNDGALKTEWQRIRKKWYYFTDNGVMQFGWQKINNKWYYLGNENDGVMKTGWVKDNGKWYFLASSGAMKTGWIKDNGKWYYLASSGAMKTGWVKDNGKWYYLASSGAMVTGTQKIGNKTYKFDSNGVCLNP